MTKSIHDSDESNEDDSISNVVKIQNTALSKLIFGIIYIKSIHLLLEWFLLYLIEATHDFQEENNGNFIFHWQGRPNKL